MNSYFLLVIGLVFLIVGAEALVKGASEIALRLKISRLVVGLTIVAIGTSLPELFISMKSALMDNPDIAIGNVVGSNICNATLILGIAALIYPIAVTKSTIKVDWAILMSISVLFLFLVLDRWVNWYDGILLSIMIVAYNFYMIWDSRKQTKADEELSGELNIGQTIGIQTLGEDFLFIALGIVALLYGSDWFVIGATDVASGLGVSQRIIGVTIVAIGTSLPELATSVVAAVRKNTDLAVGNIIGSSIFNILGILGVTAMVKEIHVEELFIHQDIIWMLLITFLLLPLMLSRMRFSKLEGLFLLFLYGLYMFSLNASSPLFSLDFL